MCGDYFSMIERVICRSFKGGGGSFLGWGGVRDI